MTNSLEGYSSPIAKELMHPEIAQREQEFAMVREITLKQAAQIARELPIPKEAGDHWHWMSFACNRIAEEILKLLPKS